MNELFRKKNEVPHNQYVWSSWGHSSLLDLMSEVLFWYEMMTSTLSLAFISNPSSYVEIRKCQRMNVLFRETSLFFFFFQELKYWIIFVWSLLKFSMLEKSVYYLLLFLQKILAIWPWFSRKGNNVPEGGLLHFCSSQKTFSSHWYPTSSCHLHM